MKRYIIGFCIILLVSPCLAQIQSNKWMEYIEEMAEETEDSETLEALYTELSYLADNPFDINHIKKEDLKKLPFLSDRHIESILSYRAKYGEMVTLYELKNIDALDFQTISLLLPFVYVGELDVDNLPITVDNLLKRGKNELVLRYDQCFQQKKGYKFQPDSILEQYPNRKYLGEPFYHSLRYSYTFDNRIQWGLTAEKDAGEPFWNNRHKGYDYYSGHLLLKDIGCIKTLALGDYKVSFGQGLVVSNDFMPGRSAMVAQAERRNNGFRRHFSTNEADFFRGAAATLTLKKMEVSMFYSYRKMDAKPDSNSFTSLKTDGLHRTVGDWGKLRQIPMQTFGGNVRYVSPNLFLGLTALTYSFGKYSMEPDEKPYNLFYFRGKRNVNVSIDYMIKNGKVKFYGETALSKNEAIATLNGLHLSPVSYISFLLLYRYYSRRYHSYYGSAFGQNGTVPNEQGIYAGLQFTPFPYWKLSVYADVFRFPWLKYGVDSPSTGKEYMVQLDYTSGKDVSAYIRYRFREKEKNTMQEDKAYRITPYQQHRLRLQFLYRPVTTLLMRTSADGILYEEENKDSNKGIMLAQSIGWKPTALPFQADFYFSWFHTDNYNTRISSYEKNLLYSFYMPSFYGKGIRLSATIRWDIIKNLSFSFKVGHTQYSDRDVIGTGLEEIEGKGKTDFYGNLRWKF